MIEKINNKLTSIYINITNYFQNIGNNKINNLKIDFFHFIIINLFQELIEFELNNNKNNLLNIKSLINILKNEDFIHINQKENIDSKKIIEYKELYFNILKYGINSNNNKYNINNLILFELFLKQFINNISNEKNFNITKIIENEKKYYKEYYSLQK
jgi:hypothetical protein